MSGTYRLRRLLDGASSDHLRSASPVDFLPDLDGDQLDTLVDVRGRRPDAGSGPCGRPCPRPTDTIAVMTAGGRGRSDGVGTRPR